MINVQERHLIVLLSQNEKELQTTNNKQKLNPPITSRYEDHMAIKTSFFSLIFKSTVLCKDKRTFKTKSRARTTGNVTENALTVSRYSTNFDR